MDKKDLLKIKDFSTLLDFLVDKLDWPIDIDNFIEGELIFTYTAKDIGLQDDLIDKMSANVKQLRPFAKGQPWAIFWLDFHSKKLPITILRRILRHFVTKSRSKNPNGPTWQKEDIMFISGHGGEQNRGVTFAHFKNLDGNEVMREFSWDNGEKSFENYINYLDSLKWSDKFKKNPEEWSSAWRGAFTGSTREAVRTSKQLAISMAWIARDIRDRVKEVYEIERDNGALHQLFDSFRKGLIHDITVDQFADMYAQTMTYGLFTARTMDTDGHFEMHEVADLIPSTNPFLKQLFKECLEVGTDHHQIDLDELGIGRLVDLLDGLNRSDGTDGMTRILEEFGRRTFGGNEDPVIHFYEEFLKEYDQIQRVDRGVYYTPDAVVDFIVRSVNEHLKTEFDLEMGLADTTTWGEMLASGRAEMPLNPKTNQKFRLDSTDWQNQYKGLPFVQILDPATGTGTFLITTITMIHDEVKNKHKRDRIETRWEDYWNNYVEAKLFPRVFGFELMMASYSVAHMRIGMHLKSLGYEFKKDQRLNVYLTNTLESADEMGDMDLFYSSISAESHEAKLVKRDRFFSVIIGNPPYNGESKNKGDWIMSLMKDYKMEPGGKEKLDERNPKWINDDYVKFLRFGQFQLERSQNGLINFINPHGFLDNPTFRGVRWDMLNAFTKITVIDLHGNMKKKEKSPDGSTDVNVFDIQQGVSINFFVKKSKKKLKDLGQVCHFDLYGKREFKYKFLSANSIGTISYNNLSNVAPKYFMVLKDFEAQKKYDEGFKVNELFSLSNVGVVTSRDSFVIDQDRSSLVSRIKDFFVSEVDQLMSKYGVKENKSWRINEVKNKAKRFDFKFLSLVTYRPFDTRFIYYNHHFIERSRTDVMQHFLSGKNLGLVYKLGNAEENSVSAMVSNNIIDFRSWSRPGMQGGDFISPLYLYQKSSDRGAVLDKKLRTPNLDIKKVNKISKNIGMMFTSEKEESKKHSRLLIF